MAEVFPPVGVFCSYAHEDELWRKRLETHMSLLIRQHLISFWHPRLIAPGTDWSNAIDAHLERASIILLLISSNFLASDYCYGVEMQRAIARHNAGEAKVIPILVRPVDWGSAPFARLKILPESKKPLSSWKKQEEALAEITASIRRMIQDWHAGRRPSSVYPPLSSTGTHFSTVGATSSSSLYWSGEPLVTVKAPINLPVSESLTKKKPDLLASIAAVGRIEVSRRTLLVFTAGAMIAAFTAGDLVGHLQTPAPASNQPLIYRGHFDVVNTVAWSPDGLQIASGSADRTVQIWNVNDGSEVYIYTKHSDRVEALAWSPDGKRIASGSVDKTVQVWNAGNGNNSFTYRGHSDKVTAVAWSPDGKLIASGSADKTVQIWDAENGNTIFIYQNHTDRVKTVAWSPDGKRIASGSDDKTVQVWDAENGGHSILSRKHSDKVTAVAWSLDGKQVASSSADRTVQVWDVYEGDMVPYPGHTGAVNTIAWSPNGKLIASGSDDKTMQVWNADDGSNVFTYHRHTGAVNTVAWSSKGKHIASGSDDKTVHVLYVG